MTRPEAATNSVQASNHRQPVQGYQMADSNPTGLCQCGCGQPTAIAKQTRRGNIKGLPLRFVRGHKSTHKSHGLTDSVEYRNWKHMLERCRNPQHPKWPRYGGRGISVCKQWLSFERFIEDMGPKPPGASIDRINNNGNYEPSNCRWATPKQQSQNTSNNVVLEHNGTSLCLAEWERVLGLYKGCLSRRLGLGEKPPHIFRDARPYHRPTR